MRDGCALALPGLERLTKRLRHRQGSAAGARNRQVPLVCRFDQLSKANGPHYPGAFSTRGIRTPASRLHRAKSLQPPPVSLQVPGVAGF
ncbi:MAG: hypothetical protein EOO80_15080 [Oxalobacteraceae bacterium]|nr:MAG: hypothetical protein EOO80_15080 [Oxalobacteraceae bacterium]